MVESQSKDWGSIFERKGVINIMAVLMDDPSGKLPFNKLRRKSGLHDVQVDRILKLLKRANIIGQEDSEYFLTIPGELREQLGRLRVAATSNYNPQKTNSIESFSKFTDRYILERFYGDATILSYRKARIYGLKKDVFSPDREKSFTKEALSIVFNLTPKDIFRDKGRISVSEAIVNLVDYVETQKKNHRAKVIENRIRQILMNRRYIKIKKIIQEYLEFWVEYLNYTDVTRDFAEELLVNDHPSPANGVPSDLMTRIPKLSESERKALLDFIEDISKYLFKEHLYPTAVSIVGHNMGGLYKP
ncbi:MAG: hypothetical protein V1702_00365 [Candidatus Woesearchaeota archaeon]